MIRCKCGELASYNGQQGDYDVYICPNGHEIRIPRKPL